MSELVKKYQKDFNKLHENVGNRGLIRDDYAFLKLCEDRDIDGLKSFKARVSMHALSVSFLHVSGHGIYDIAFEVLKRVGGMYKSFLFIDLFKKQDLGFFEYLKNFKTSKTPEPYKWLESEAQNILETSLTCNAVEFSQYILKTFGEALFKPEELLETVMNEGFVNRITNFVKVFDVDPSWLKDMSEQDSDKLMTGAIYADNLGAYKILKQHITFYQSSVLNFDTHVRCAVAYSSRILKHMLENMEVDQGDFKVLFERSLQSSNLDSVQVLLDYGLSFQDLGDINIDSGLVVSPELRDFIFKLRAKEKVLNLSFPKLDPSVTEFQTLDDLRNSKVHDENGLIHFARANQFNKVSAHASGHKTDKLNAQDLLTLDPAGNSLFNIMLRRNQIDLLLRLSIWEKPSEALDVMQKNMPFLYRKKYKQQMLGLAQRITLENRTPKCAPIKRRVKPKS